MARRNIQFISGEYYHIFNRGTNRTSIFRDERDFLDVLRRMKEYVVKLNLSIVAYCLLPNHYHWLVRQNSAAKAGLFPQRVFNGYARTFNGRYKRSGTIFEGKYRAILVNDDRHLRHLCRYIHANPVKHKIGMVPELWPYSNYLEWLGKRDGTLIDRAIARTLFPDPERYRRYVDEYINGLDKGPGDLNDYLSGLD